MRPKRRTIFKAVNLLIAGATLNVAVAWGCAMFGKIDQATGGQYFIDYNVVWWVEVIQGPVKGQASSRRLIHTAGLLGDDQVPQLPGWWALSRQIPANTKDSLHQQVSGWPKFSVWCEFSNDWINWPNVIARGAIDVDPRNVNRSLVPRLLPYRPLWPGFAINTLFYAGVLWMLFCGPFALRRMIRRRRGLCPACAYPIGQSPVCTECGAAVRSKESVA